MAEPYNHGTLRIRRMGVDTYQESIIYMREDCHVCRSEGFEALNRVAVNARGHTIIATLNVVRGEGGGLRPGEAGLSEHAWAALGAHEGDAVLVTHAPPRESFGYVRAKIFGHPMEEAAIRMVVREIAGGHYSGVEVAAFLAACAGDRMSVAEVTGLTRAMVETGERLRWDHAIVVDKHGVGGLPGNRTTPIIVPVISALGLCMPKTSSRAITSPSGTADTMEVLAPVELPVARMRRVVEQEGGCIVWGGAVSLSPVDDILIRTERVLDLDGEGQMVASVLSKKVAAGSTHVVIDMPVGPTAKVRTSEAAAHLAGLLVEVGRNMGLQVVVMEGSGQQPIGRGIGPALEARDLLAVLRQEAGRPADLETRSLELAGAILELAKAAAPGQGADLAAATLRDGRALRKFEAICAAQGGMREVPDSRHRHEVCALSGGEVAFVDNRRLSKAAKLAGAPQARAAGVDLHVRLGSRVEAGQPLYTLHAETPGELDYALDYVTASGNGIRVEAR